MKELDIKISYQCNNNCVFCLNQDKRLFGNTITDIKSAIVSFVQNDGKRLIVSGGEPLISRHFFDLLYFAKRQGIISFVIQTNGRMLYYEPIVLELLKNFTSIAFLVSLHFPNKKLYKKYSQSDGFNQTVGGIKNLIKHNCFFTTNTVVMKPNLYHLKEIVYLLKEIGASRQAQYRFIDGKNMLNKYKKFVPSYNECVPIIQKVIEENTDINFCLREFPICILGEQLKDKMAPFINSNRLNLVTNNELITTKKIEGDQFIFPDQCTKCIYNEETCPGIRKEYAKIYGTKEFKPIKNCNFLID